MLGGVFEGYAISARDTTERHVDTLCMHRGCSLFVWHILYIFIRGSIYRQVAVEYGVLRDFCCFVFISFRIFASTAAATRDGVHRFIMCGWTRRVLFIETSYSSPINAFAAMAARSEGQVKECSPAACRSRVESGKLSGGTTIIMIRPRARPAQAIGHCLCLAAVTL